MFALSPPLARVLVGSEFVLRELLWVGGAG